MKKALVLVALLGLVAAANAEYRIFFTNAQLDPYGLTNPGLIGNPSQAITSDDNPPPPAVADYSNNLDVYDGHYVVTAFPTYSTAVPQINHGEWVYMWGQFFNEANGARMFSATLDITTGGAMATDVNPVYYKVDDMFTGKKRWDGASTEADNYAAFRNIHQDLTAVTANGLKNPAPADASENWNLWSGGKNDGLSGRIHLLGAIQAGMTNGMYTVTIPADGNGDPLFVISNVPTWPVVGSFEVIPEPASLLLLGLAGLLIRRR